MARRLRVEYPGAIYHVTVRMLGESKSENCRLFVDDKDRERLLDRLAGCVEEYGVRLYQYCLMRNHFHLVLETPEGNLSKFMHALSTGYTVYYNLRHERHGHLFDGRFKAKLVQGDDYLLAVTRYVHLNPVHVAGWEKKPVGERVKYLRLYPWSTYRSYIGKEKRKGFVSYDPVLELLSGKRSRRTVRYREFVESGLVERDEDLELIKNGPGLGIGDDEFLKWVGMVYEKMALAHAHPEDVAFRKISVALEPEEVLEVVAGGLKVDCAEFLRKTRNSPNRAVAARCLIRYAGMSQRDAAIRLGMSSGAAVSLQLKRMPELLELDAVLRKTVDGIEISLSEQRKKRSKELRQLIS